MCVLCSEFSCRVGNNHQIQRKKREDELAQQTFLFFTFFRCIIPSLRPDIDAINGQDDVYLEFVPILDIYYSCNAIKFISFDPLQPTIPCQTEMSCHHFPNWLAIYQWLSIFHQSTRNLENASVVSIKTKYQEMFPKRNRSFKEFCHKEIVKNRRNRKIVLKLHLTKKRAVYPEESQKGRKALQRV